MPRTVIIIRHADAQAHADRSPASWPLSAVGREGAAALGGRIPTSAFLASSGELKAVETICLATGAERSAIHIDDHFGEVHRPGEPFDDDYRERRRAWIVGRPDDRHARWETPAQAADRFQEGLDRIDADVVAVATHGMVLTAWLVAVGRVGRGDPAGDFWARLTFPEVLGVEV